MAESQPELPYGWIMKQSRSHPDRVYYFNVNTGASTWEVPDLLQPHLVGNVGHPDPVLSSTSVDITSHSKLPAALNGPSKLPAAPSGPIKLPAAPSGPSKLLAALSSPSKLPAAPSGPSKLPAAASSLSKLPAALSGPSKLPAALSSPTTTASPPVCLTVEAEFSPEPSDYSSSPSPAKHRIETPHAYKPSTAEKGAGKRASHTAVDKPMSVQRRGDSSTVQQHRSARLHSQASKNHSKTIPHSRPSPVKNANNKHHSNKTNAVRHNEKKEYDHQQAEMSSKSSIPTTKIMHKKHRSDTARIASHSNQNDKKKSDSSNRSTAGKITNDKLHSEKSRKVEVVSKDFPQSLISNKTDKKSHNKSPVKKRKFSPVRSPEATRPTKSRKYEASSLNRHVVCKKSKEQSVEDSDSRKVIKCLQADPAGKRSITVKPEPVCQGVGRGRSLGQDLVVSTTVEDTPSPQQDHTSLDANRSSAGSRGSAGSGDEGTAVKVFIGDKTKLLTIQSWIDNLQQGSDSPARDFYSHLDQVGSPSMDRSTDSGYASVASSKVRTERGWPGELRRVNVEDREIVPMEVDTWDLPEGGAGPGGDAGVAMEIDSVLVEVRQEVKANPSSHCDIDVPQSTLKQQGLLVVVDTNILVSNLGFLQNLRDSHIKGHSQPVLYIPWIVLQELDRLKLKHISKHNTTYLATQTAARQAIRFLKAQFTSNHPRVLGQTPREADTAAQEFSACCNDDAILQACLYCQRLYCSSGVVLLTNDINLINKALVSSVKAFSSTEFMESVKQIPLPVSSSSKMNSVMKCCASEAAGLPVQPAVCSAMPTTLPADRVVSALQPSTSHLATLPHTQHSSQSDKQHADSTQAVTHSDNKRLNVFPSASLPCSSCEPVRKLSVLPAASRAGSSCMTERLLHEETHYTEEALVEEIQCRLKSALREGLGKILELEMKTAYDDIWLDIVYRKPPWSLKDILECWKKHWIGVFGLVINRGLKENVDRLLEAFSGKQGGSIQEMLQVCEDCLPILQECSHKQQYGEAVWTTRQCVEAICELCRGITRGHTSVQSVASLDAYLQSRKRVQFPTDTESASICIAPTKQSTATATGTQSVSGSSCPSNTIQEPVRGPGGSNVISPSDNNMIRVPPEVAAGELLQNIWQFIYKYCDEIYEALKGSLTDEGRNKIEALIQRLVPNAKTLRILYTGLLELPVPELSAHEDKFSAFTQHCNTFFTKLQAQEAGRAPPVTPAQFLVLFSMPQHRQTLDQFQQQLDAMLRHLYGCLNILYPDD